jgi:hypothetical protein
MVLIRTTDFFPSELAFLVAKQVVASIDTITSLPPSILVELNHKLLKRALSIVEITQEEIFGSNQRQGETLHCQVAKEFGLGLPQFPALTPHQHHE